MSCNRYHARWVLPITSTPIKDGWVEIVDGAITAIGASRPVGSPEPFGVDLGERVIMPGVVNAHTHLELSGLQGRIPRATSMPSWARTVMDERPKVASSLAGRVPHAASECRRCGTALVGDIANTLDSLDTLRTECIDATLFHEFLGFDIEAADADNLVEPVSRQIAERLNGRVKIRAAAHAPYSVSAELFCAIGRLPGPRSVHLAESEEEVEFLLSGGGPWRNILEERGRMSRAWVPPGLRPVDYLESVGWLRDDTIAVHGVQLVGDEIDRLAQAGTTLVVCPRSNDWTGAGVPAISEFYIRGLRVAIGTDSLASAPDLNVFKEMSEVRRLAPDVSAAQLLESATLVGAQALGWGRSHGAIELGRQAALIAVEIPTGISDVEEYLLSGIEPCSITWLEETAVS
jgi:cytosine/adenosine deaminase-related metal-dependent hydrolase